MGHFFQPPDWFLKGRIWLDSWKMQISNDSFGLVDFRDIPAQNIKSPIKRFFNKCDQIRRKLAFNR